MNKTDKRETINIKAVNDIELIPIMIKAMQELQSTIQQQQSFIEKEQRQIDELRQMVALPSSLSSAYLKQNVPNPYNTNTTISYYLPANAHNAYINFYASNGALLKSVKLAGGGNGTINITASELPSGAYRDSLIIDGKVADSKQMVQAK